MVNDGGTCQELGSCSRISCSPRHETSLLAEGAWFRLEYQAPPGATDMLALALSVLLTFASANEAAQTITGVVIDPDGRPVPNARVLLEIADRFAGEARTALDGRFEV